MKKQAPSPSMAARECPSVAARECPTSALPQAPGSCPTPNLPETLLAVVKAELLELPPRPALFAAFTPQHWNDFYKLCCRQGVGTLVFHYLKRLKELPAQPVTSAEPQPEAAAPTPVATPQPPAPAEPQPEAATERPPLASSTPPLALYMQWALHAENNKARRQIQLNAALKLHQMLADHGIEMMILKGIGLSSLYPDPSLREFGDLDIYLYGKQALADQILTSAYGIPVSTDVHLHTVFALDGVPVENHYDFINTSAHPSSRALEKTLKHLALSQKPEELLVKGAERCAEAGAGAAGSAVGSAVGASAAGAGGSAVGSAVGSAGAGAAGAGASGAASASSAAGASGAAGPNLPRPEAHVRLQIPSATLAALFYFFHTASHFAATSIPLRNLCDWYVLLKAYHAKIDFALLHQTCARRHALPFLHCLNQLIIKLFDADPRWFGAEGGGSAAGSAGAGAGASAEASAEAVGSARAVGACAEARAAAPAAATPSFADRSFPDQHLTDQHLTDQHLPDQHLPDQRIADQRIADRCLQDIFHPAYPEIPEQGISSIWPRYKRFRANAWKHRIVYPEPVWWTFLQSSLAHLRKPKTI